MAIVLGHADVLASIVQQRIDCNIPATGDEVNALSIAWQYMKDKSKFLDCIKILFRLPGFLNISDINKSIEGTRNPMLHHAVQQQRFDIVKDLCSNPHVDLDARDDDGKTVVQVSPFVHLFFYILRPPRGVCEAHLHPSYKHCVTGTSPSQTYGNV